MYMCVCVYIERVNYAKLLEKYFFKEIYSDGHVHVYLA